MLAWITTREIFPKKVVFNTKSYYRSWVRLWISLFFALTSCTDTKVSQCNNLILTINQTEQELYSITQTSKADINALGDIAATTQRSVIGLKALDLDNSRLKRFQKEFLTFYESISNDAQVIVDAHSKQNMMEAETAYYRLEQTFQGQTRLVERVNDYCSQGYDQ